MRREMMNADLSFLVPLGATVLLEVLTGFLLGLRGKKELLLVVLVNVLTNPLLHLLAGGVYVLAGREWMRIAIYAVLEPLVILAEGWIYQFGLKVSHPYCMSFIMNLVSITGGVVWTLLSH